MGPQKLSFRKLHSWSCYKTKAKNLISFFNLLFVSYSSRWSQLLPKLQVVSRSWLLFWVADLYWYLSTKHLSLKNPLNISQSAYSTLNLIIYPIPRYGPPWIFAISMNRRTSNLINSLAHHVQLIILSYLFFTALYTPKTKDRSLGSTVKADFHSFSQSWHRQLTFL